MYEKEWNVKKSVADSVEEIIYYRAQYFHEDLSISGILHTFKNNAICEKRTV